MAIRFVDSGGNDANDGLDNIGVGLATATWTESTLTLTQTGHGYTFATGDVIYIASGTGATTGLYEVVSSTVNNIVLKGTSALLDVGNADDFAAGDLASADIVSSNGADLTADAAFNAIVAGDTVYLRSDKTYTELVTIDTVGTTSNAVRIVGYTTTLDDDGQATIDAADTRTNCVADSLGNVGVYYSFENIKFTDATGDCLNLSLNVIHFRHCEFSGAGTDGINTTGNGVQCESCIFFDTAGKGCDAGTSCGFYGCTFEDCAGDAIEITWGVVINCIFINTGSSAIDFNGANGFPCAVYGCTFDGVGNNTSTAISFPASFWGPYVAINNLIYDCAIGISGNNNGNHRFIGRNNLLNSNGTDYSNTGYRTEPGEQTGAPLFESEAGEDYRLGSSSPAIEAGFDAYVTEGQTQKADIGALQLGGGGGGGSGGLLMPNKRGNKQ